MNQKDKLILGKLLALAEKQQKIITKLAQQDLTATIKSIAEVAAMNLNLGKPIGVKVSSEGAGGPLPTGGTANPSYKVEISGLPDNQSKLAWKNNFDRNVALKPELKDLNLAVFYT